MADHHAVDFTQVGTALRSRPKCRTTRRVVPTCETAENGELFRIQLLARAIDLGQFVMRIERGGGIAGKMFATAQNSLCAHGVVECARVLDHFVDRLSVTATA